MSRGCVNIHFDGFQRVLRGEWLPSEVSRFIKDWLRREQTTQTWLAAQSGVKRSTLNAILKKNVQPRAEQLTKLAAAMGVPRNRLFVLAGYMEEALVKEKSAALTEDEERLLNEYRQLPAEARRYAHAAILGMLGRGTPPRSRAQATS